jgi:hypothetical protein
MSDETVQEVIDREHLRLLSLGYLISGGMSAFFSLFGLVYLGLALFLFLASSSMGADPKRAGEAPPPEVALIVALAGIGFFPADGLPGRAEVSDGVVPPATPVPFLLPGGCRNQLSRGSLRHCVGCVFLSHARPSLGKGPV